MRKAVLSGLLFISVVLTVNANLDLRAVYVMPSKNDIEITIPKKAIDNAPPDVFRLKFNELE